MQIRFIDKDKNRNMFFAVLRQRVDAHFKEKNVSKHYNAAMIIKTIILLTGYLGSYAAIILMQPSVGVSMLLWSAAGFAMAGIGMSVMHDANHGAYSGDHKVNHWIGLSLNLLGGSVFNWKVQHNFLHHTYTNVVHMDDDIDDKLVMRFSPHTEVKWYQRFQFIYAFFFYGILTLYWVLLKDFVQYALYKKEGHHQSVNDKKGNILAKIVLSKIFYFAIFLALPIIFSGLSVGAIICGFLLMHFIAGLVLTTIFQLAHTVDDTTHPVPDKDGLIENAWAIHQLNTTVNFSRSSKWISWYVGGLNFQVEHHLFPTICHVHYPEIAPIVKATAEEYGVPYLENKTFVEALQSHVSALKRLGSLPPINEALSG